MEKPNQPWTLTWDRSSVSDRITLDDAHDRRPMMSTMLCVRF
jgi:hypothetical protein